MYEQNNKHLFYTIKCNEKFKKIKKKLSTRRESLIKKGLE